MYFCLYFSRIDHLYIQHQQTQIKSNIRSTFSSGLVSTDSLATTSLSSLTQQVAYSWLSLKTITYTQKKHWKRSNSTNGLFWFHKQTLVPYYTATIHKTAVKSNKFSSFFFYYFFWELNCGVCCSTSTTLITQNTVNSKEPQFNKASRRWIWDGRCSVMMRSGLRCERSVKTGELWTWRQSGSVQWNLSAREKTTLDKLEIKHPHTHTYKHTAYKFYSHKHVLSDKPGTTCFIEGIWGKIH